MPPHFHQISVKSTHTTYSMVLPECIQRRRSKVSSNHPRNDHDGDRERRVSSEHGADSHGQRRRDVPGKGGEPEGVGQTDQPTCKRCVVTSDVQGEATARDSVREVGSSIPRWMGKWCWRASRMHCTRCVVAHFNVLHAVERPAFEKYMGRDLHFETLQFTPVNEK